MMTNAPASKTTTYQQLSEVLTQLGFQRRVTPQFTAYRNAQFDALLVLPQDALSERVRPLHLAAARATVVGKGVATAVEFDRLLLHTGRKRGLQAVTASPSTGEPSASVSLLPGDPAAGPRRGVRAEKAVSAKKRTKKPAAASALAASAAQGE